MELGWAPVTARSMKEKSISPALISPEQLHLPPLGLRLVCLTIEGEGQESETGMGSSTPHLLFCGCLRSSVDNGSLKLL